MGSVLAGVLLAGCSGLGDGDDTTDAETWPCLPEEGLVRGVVYVDGVAGDEPAEVLARNDDGEQLWGSVDDDGSYGLCLAPGDWHVVASVDSCVDGADVTVVAGQTTDLDLEVDSGGCDTADKPNLYLYPEAPTRTSVTIGIGRGQEVIASDPPYLRGWQGVALPDGRFATTAGVAPFLFYEVSLRPAQVRTFQRDEGWCFEGDVREAVFFMAGLLEDYAFNAAEVDDFVEGWRVDLPPAAAYAVYPQLDVAHAAALDIQPALPVDRLWLLVEEAGACAGTLPSPAVFPFERRGAHAVEWGVVLSGMAK